MRNNFIDTVIAAGRSREDLIFLSGDAGLGVFDDLRQHAPESFLNMGVAEQNMASFAAGLALTGCKVYLYNIIPFLFYRCYEQIRNDICYQELPVVLAGIGSGITYAPQGMSHYSIEDLGIAATLPNLAVFSPCDSAEARAVAEYSLNAPGPVYVRLAKRGERAIHSSPVEDITRPQLLRKGGACAILFHGSIAEEIIDAAELLQSAGISATLISIPMVQPLHEESLLEMIASMELVVTVEEHYSQSGLGGALARLAADNSPDWRLKTAGIPYAFIHDINDCKGLRKRFGLDAAQLAQRIIEWCHDR